MIFAISAFTVISLSVGVMFDLIRKIVEFGLPLFLALKVLFFSLPSFLVLSFPMAVLLSTLLAYGKLSSNSELLALKSLGIKERFTALSKNMEKEKIDTHVASLKRLTDYNQMGKLFKVLGIRNKKSSPLIGLEI